MSQSVKLKDESYIDASGVWVNDRQETVEDALKCSRVYLESYIEAAGYLSDNTIRAEKQGRMVTVIFAALATDSTAGNTTWCTLPEGYRPQVSTLANAQYRFSPKTHVHAYIEENGNIVAYDGIPAKTWWQFTVSYLTD